MLNVSNAFNEAFKNPTRQVLVRITMKNVVYTNNDIFNVDYTGGSITGETFNVGSVFSNSIKITFTKVIEAIKQLDKIKLEFGIVLADGTKEFVSMGYFFVDKYNPDRNANRTVIEALDQMTQLERVYKSNLSYPARIKDIALEIANLSGSVVDQVSFERLPTSAIIKFEGKTYRQAIGLIAQFAGGFAIFDRDAKLSIRTLSDPNFAISTSDYFSRGLTKTETMYTLGGISCKVSTKNGDTTSDFMLQSGSPLGNQIALENSSMTQILLDSIYQQLKDTNYYPYTLSWRGNPALEAGDWISMSDTKDNSFKMPNLSYKLSFSGGLKATSSADTSSVSQASASYRGPLKQQVLELQGWRSSSGGWTYTGTTEPTSPKEGDVWFKPNGPDTETWIYEKGKWVFQTSTAGIRKVKEEMDQAQKDIKEAKKAADDAVDKANANVKAIEVNTDAIGVVSTATADAKRAADLAVRDANSAKTDAKSALDKANGVSSKVITIETNIDTINGTLVTKANTTDVDAVKKRVSTAETSISQNSNDIKVKANQSDVNVVTGKISSLESNLSVQAGQITALNTKTDGNVTQIGILKSSYDGLTSTVANVESSLSQNNLVYNSTLQSGADGWVMQNGFAQSSARNISGNYIVNFSLQDNSDSTWYFARSRQVPIGIWKEYAYAAAFMRRSDIPNNGVFVFGVEGYDSSGNRVEFNTVNIHSQMTDDKWTILSDMYEFTNSNVKTVCFTLATNGFGHYIACQPIMVNSGTVGNFVPDGMDKGQITQMVQDLDGFKFTVANTYADKNTVTSQITQSATQVRQDVQNWTNGRLTSYSTIQSTDSSIASAVADKVTKTQLTQLSSQVTSTVSQISNSTNLFSIKRMQSSNDYHPAFPSFLLVRVPTDVGATYTASTDNPNQNLWFIPDRNSDPGASTYRVYGSKTVTFTATNTLSYAVIRDTSTKNQLSNETYHLKIERGTSVTLWSPSEVDSVSQSQFTQSIDNINLRIVEKGTVTSQINLESGRVLIDTNQLLLNASTVRFSGSAFIPDAMIQTLTASKINTGTLNAANVNIINLNANNISSGYLSSDRILANSITADKIRATSLDLFNNDTYTNIRADGMRIQSKAQIVFGNWRDSSNTLRTTQGVYIGGVGGGTKHLAFTRSNGTTFMLRAEEGMDYGTNQNVRIDLLNIYDSTQFWESINVKRDIITSGYIAMGGAVQESSIQYSSSEGTMNFRVPGGRSGSYFWFNQRAISEGSFDSRSKLSLKNVKGDYKGNALDDIVNTNIVEYSYKNDPQRRQLSPIIDDINEIKKYHLPDIINDGESVSLYAMGSLSWLAIKQLAKKLENIEEKLDAIA